MIETDARKSFPPEDLDFENTTEKYEEKAKRLQIELLLQEGYGVIQISQLKELARSDYGLVTDELRRILWPQLISIDVTALEPAPKLYDLQSHPEYHQVVLDVNRSLKRFPPGIPYEQRIALQDQLTVLILRVITKYPHLRYYQGYHDVAITFLLVVGEKVAFAVMEILSTTHFLECMLETMDATQRRLMHIWPIINFENASLFQYLRRSGVGTLFALPWYLTWFGHSLNSYKLVVRLYDYFLASPIHTPLFVTAAIILHRTENIFLEDCDMASIHCLLSKIPENLPFENLLKVSSQLYEKYPMDLLSKEVDKLERIEREERMAEEKLAKTLKRKAESRNNRNYNNLLNDWFLHVLNRKSVIVTTAFSIFVGLCAYYYKNQYISTGVS